ncbi:MAG: cytochrome c3 family protein [Planctomycetota bacterium]|jgi:hypothetical protein
MNRNLATLAAALLTGGAAVLFFSPSGCNRGSDPVGVERGSPALRGPNAYDTIKMCRISDEEGPVYFAHDLHADLVDPSGLKIRCVRCHHELKETPDRTPKGCSKCHLPHDHFEARDLLTM